MFLFRPGTATIKARFLVLWFRAKEIDVLEEVGSPQDAQSKCKVYPNSSHSDGEAHSRVFMKVVPEVAVKNRFHEQLDCVMTLQKAVLRDSNTYTGGVGNSNNSAMDTSDSNKTTTITITTTTTANADNTHQYFDSHLQHTLRTQFNSSAFKSALETLVLSQPMQIIMGYTVSRNGGGNEDFIDTRDGFYRKPSPIVGFNAPVSTKSRVLMGFGDMEEGELEEGEEREEADIEDSVVFNSIGSHMGVAGSANGVNKKIYFPDHTTTTTATATATTNTTTKPNSSDSSSSSSSDEEDGMAVLLANNARKRKAQQLAENSESTGSDSEGKGNTKFNAITNTANGNSTMASPNKKPKPSTTTTTTSTNKAVPPPPPPPPPPPAPTNISDLISMYTPQTLKTPSKTTTTSATTITNAAASGPPLPFPLPTPTISINTTTTTTGSNNSTSTNTSGGTSGFPQPPLPFPLPTPTISINNAMLTTTTTTTTPLVPYQCTLIDTSTIPTPLEMVALDCEMCTTLAGLELTRLTVLCPLNGVVYDTLVSTVAIFYICLLYLRMRVQISSFLHINGYVLVLVPRPTLVLGNTCCCTGSLGNAFVFVTVYCHCY